jgi:hypothetical protein
MATAISNMDDVHILDPPDRRPAAPQVVQSMVLETTTTRAEATPPTEPKPSQGGSTHMAPPKSSPDAGASPRRSPRAEKLAREAEEEEHRGLTFEGIKSATAMFQFANTEEIKEKVRMAKLRPPPYDVKDRYKTRGFFQWLARHSYFENTTLSIIVFNALWISIDTDGNTADTILDAKVAYITADVMFFGYFSFELIVRFMAFAKKKHCLRDGWFVFDSTLVTLYAFDPFTIGLMAHISGGGGLNLPTAVLRLFRLARLSRLIRMLRSLPELMIMIKGMVTAAASVGYTLGLLMLITYVFAIALVNLAPPGEDVTEEFFSSVPATMHNLIVFAVFLDALADFIIPVKEQSTVCFMCCWIYICLAAMTVMNMLIGVLCEVISAVAEEEKESMMVDKVHEKFSQIVEQLDKNSDGNLSWDEFQQILEFPDALQELENMNVDSESMVDMAEDFFFDDGEPVPVSFDQFMDMVLDLRGGQQGTVENIMALQKRFNKKFFAMSRRIDGIDGSLAGIDQKLDEMLKKKGVTPIVLVRQSTHSTLGGPPSARPSITKAPDQEPEAMEPVSPATQS